MAVKIVTDSTCDIAPENVDRLDISVVPAYVLFGEESYRQGIDINPTQFYARLQSSPQLPSTSQPTPGRLHGAVRVPGCGRTSGGLSHRGAAAQRDL